MPRFIAAGVDFPSDSCYLDLRLIFSRGLSFQGLQGSQGLQGAGGANLVPFFFMQHWFILDTVEHRGTFYAILLDNPGC